MKYCENCKIVFEDGEICPQCFSKVVREVKPEDFCFLTEIQRGERENYENYFAEMDVPCAFIPSGSGLETKFGMRLNYLKVFVPYEFYDFCCNALFYNAEDKEDQLFDKIVEGLNDLFITLTPKKEAKVRKKLKISDEENIVDAVKERILSFDRIVDGGRITDGNGENYYFVYSGDLVISLNSETFEILAID